MPLRPFVDPSRRLALFPIVAVLLLAASSAGADTAADAAKKGALAAPIPLPTLSPLVKRVMPSVVNIVAEIPPDAVSDGGETAGRSSGTPFDDFMRRYFEQHGLPTPPPPAKDPAGSKGVSLGSGFIIDPAGYIVTNNHVVTMASKITVVFQDNSKHPATVVGTDPKTDLAVLKIAAKAKLPALQWGDSDKVEVGDWVMTVGNPFGLGGTVTTGIVSALGRDIQQGPFDDFLQIDAPINRGSSGGPTFDTSGRVVGINTAIYSPSGGSVGIGFAIPSSIGRLVVKHLQEEGHANHGYLGISVQVVGPELAGALRMDPVNPQGLIVVEIAADSPAEQAGLKVGDVIKTANGHPTQAVHDVSRLVGTARVGDKLALVVDRDGTQVKIDATIAKALRADPNAPIADQAPTSGATQANSARGLWFAALTSELRQEDNLSPTATGVVIGGIAEDSPAAAIGLVPGDVVLSIDRLPIAGPEDAAGKLRLASATGDVLLLINRHGNPTFTALPAEAGASKP
ncbi:MAG TPA: Do family serine endopeptidase [Aliidongia sp.]|uniref:Do family serine endopeptidase n=1 Tax=Aliidongia sp. TaxID=1914230 RepID=UPI002DDC910D|nr:Do family serine endopeptidase [Aliidongia sp.]HEV2675013.1 Do family serine endopeptidase [Aliidongia sp.]